MARPRLRLRLRATTTTMATMAMVTAEATATVLLFPLLPLARAPCCAATLWSSLRHSRELRRRRRRGRGPPLTQRGLATLALPALAPSLATTCRSRVPSRNPSARATLQTRRRCATFLFRSFSFPRRCDLREGEHDGRACERSLPFPPPSASSAPPDRRVASHPPTRNRVEAAGRVFCVRGRQGRPCARSRSCVLLAPRPRRRRPLLMQAQMRRRRPGRASALPALSLRAQDSRKKAARAGARAR